MKKHTVLSPAEVQKTALMYAGTALLVCVVGFLPWLVVRYYVDLSQWKATIQTASLNPNWEGVVSTLPYFFAVVGVIGFALAMSVYGIVRMCINLQSLHELNTNERGRLTNLLNNDMDGVEPIRNAIKSGVPLRVRDIEFVEECKVEWERHQASVSLRNPSRPTGA